MKDTDGTGASMHRASVEASISEGTEEGGGVWVVGKEGGCGCVG